MSDELFRYYESELLYFRQLAEEFRDQCRLGDGAQLGWNTWVRSGAFPHDADDPAFAGEGVVFLN